MTGWIRCKIVNELWSTHNSTLRAMPRFRVIKPRVWGWAPT